MSYQILMEVFSSLQFNLNLNLNLSIAMPSNIRFRYTVCSCKMIVRAEQASRHFKTNPTHTVLKVYTCCVACCQMADQDSINSGQFYIKHRDCLVCPANNQKTKVFIQMKMNEEGASVGEKRPAENDLSSQTVRRRTLSLSSMSSSESDFETPTLTAEKELDLAVKAIEDTVLTGSTPMEPQPEAQSEAQPGTQHIEAEQEQEIEKQPEQRAEVHPDTTPAKNAIPTKAKQSRGVKAQGRKWDKDSQAAAISQTIHINKLTGKIRTQESLIKTLQESLGTAQKRIIEDKLDVEEVVQIKKRCYEKEKELEKIKNHYEDIIRSQHREYEALKVKNVELEERLRQRMRVEEEERTKRKEVEEELRRLKAYENNTEKKRSLIHVPHFQHTVLSDEVDVSRDLTSTECAANEEIGCIHLYAEHEGDLNVMHVMPPTTRMISEKTRQLINSIKFKRHT